MGASCINMDFSADCPESKYCGRLFDCTPSKCPKCAEAKHAPKKKKPAKANTRPPLAPIPTNNIPIPTTTPSNKPRPRSIPNRGKKRTRVVMRVPCNNQPLNKRRKISAIPPPLLPMDNC